MTTTVGRTTGLDELWFASEAAELACVGFNAAAADELGKRVFADVDVVVGMEKFSGRSLALLHGLASSTAHIGSIYSYPTACSRNEEFIADFEPHR